jgi:hypothetical protein
MVALKEMFADAYKVEIFIGGDYTSALDICQKFCDRGLCVTVEPTMYVFKGGRCAGVRVGLINYARFDTNRANIWATANDLALDLLEGLGQGSFTVQDDKRTRFFTRRIEDGCDG